MEKPLGEISICELCSGAGVGRTSFYRNFESKEDILKAYIRQLFLDWTEKWEKEAECPVEELVRRIFSHVEEHRVFYSLLNERGLVYLLKDVVLKLCHFDPQQEKTAAYYVK